MRWAGHVACLREERKVCKVLVEKSKGRRPLGRHGIRAHLRKIGCRVWSGYSWLRKGPTAGCCECGYEPSGCSAPELVSSLFLPHPLSSSSQSPPSSPTKVKPYISVAPEPDGSSPHSQQPATDPYPEPTESAANPPVHLPNIHSDLNVPSTPPSSEWTLSFRLPNKTLHTSLSSPICATCPAHFIRLP
jgi:hypothetical protein